MKRLPLWLRISLVAVILVLVAGLLLPYLLDVDRYRTLVASVIENQAGRKVAIAKIRARVLPHVGFVMEGVRLSHPPGFPEGDMLAVEAIRGKLALAPLLRREFRLTSVEMVRPKLVLLENDRGQTNYSFPDHPSQPSGASKRLAASAPGGSFSLAEIESLDLTEVDVTFGRVGDRGRSVVPSLRVQKISATISHLALDPVRLKQWQGEAKLSGVRIEVTGWKEPIAVRAGRLRLREGQIESDFRAAIGKAAETKGALRVADVEKPVVEFELNASELDVDKLLAVQAEAAPAAAPRARPRSSEHVAQGRLTAEHLRWSPYVTDKANAELRIFTDRVELWPVTVELYGGTLQVSARSDRTQTPGRFSSNVQVRNLDVGKLLAASAARGKLSGIGELNLQLFGSLTPEIRKSLTGSGNFAVRNGRLPGLNLSGGLESLARLTGVGGDTPFTLLQGDLSIAQGRVVSKQIHLHSPEGTVDLHGSLGLDGTLNYDGQAVLAPSGAGGKPTAVDAVAGILGGVLKQNVSRITVPISIRGTLQDPKFLPGAGRIAVESSTPPSKGQPAPPPPKKGILDLFRRP